MKKNNLRPIKIVIVMLLLLSFATIALACNKTNIQEKFTLAEVMDIYQTTSTKKVVTNIDINFIYYDSDGKEARFTETLALERTAKDNKIYVKGAVATPYRTKTTNAIFSLIKSQKDIYSYLTGKGEIVFELGYNNGTINARGDLVTDNQSADYVLGDGYKSFLAVKEADIYSFINDLDKPSFNKINIKELLMSPLVVELSPYPLELTSIDNADDKLNINDDSYYYDLNISEKDIMTFMSNMIDSQIDEMFPTAEDKQSENYKTLQKYLYDTEYNFKKIMLNWVSTDKLNANLTVNSQGKITENQTAFTIYIDIPDKDIKHMALSLGLEDIIADSLDINLEGDAVVDFALFMFHRFLYSKNKQDKTSFIIDVTISEQYYYDNISFDAGADVLFTPYDSQLAERFKIEYIANTDADKETRPKKWNVLDLDIK